MAEARTIGALDAQFLLTRAWHAKGVAARAIQGYRQVLAAQPDHLGAALFLGSLLMEHGRPQQARVVYQSALEFHPNESRLHKGFANAVIAADGLDALFAHYRLSRQDHNELDLQAPEPICCTVLRNELPRLPYFLEFYRAHGIRHFFAVDNGSTDGSLEFLLAQRDVCLWQSDLSFQRANFGAGWFEPLLRRYGLGNWVLIVDADELFYFPGCETRSIPHFCRDLDRAGKRAYDAVLLDMYSDRPVDQTRYQAGERFEDVCPFFDRQFYHRVFENGGPFQNQQVLFGGARERVFGRGGEYYISKVPLVKYEAGTILAGGQHWTNLPPSLIADGRGALLHFKYFASFRDYVLKEAQRGEHYGGAMQYREYAKGLAEPNALTLYDPDHSVRLNSSEDLEKAGVLNRGAHDRPAIEFPRIEPAPGAEPRPIWSVVVTVYDRVAYLEQSLGSVLRQAPAADRLQIIVLIDGPAGERQQRVADEVRAIAGDRVEIHKPDQNVGHPEIFNVAIRRSRGQWVHLLHDDDWVAPGFYAAMEAGIAGSPDIVAAFARHAYTDLDGNQLRLSPLEAESAGPLDQWLARITGYCRLQTPSIVVKRAAYEAVGGYCAEAGSAFDWEMWVRLAAHGEIFYEPRVLAYFREGQHSLSSGLILDGRQIADTQRVAAVSQAYLSADQAESMVRRSAEHYAMLALDYAEAQLTAGNLNAALANQREALRCSQSRDVMRRLANLLIRCPQTTTEPES